MATFIWWGAMPKPSDSKVTHMLRERHHADIRLVHLLTIGIWAEEWPVAIVIDDEDPHAMEKANAALKGAPSRIPIYNTQGKIIACTIHAH